MVRMFKISYKMTRILTPISFWKPIGPSFISKYTTTTSNEDIHLPYLTDGLYSGTIDWGDGNTSDNSYANRIHTYVSSGTHTITITGQIEGYNNFYFGGSSASKLVEITQWGSLNCSPPNSSIYAPFVSESFAFAGCSNLILDNVTDTLNITSTYIDGMFSGCTSLVTCPYMNQWNVSSVESMTYMFEGCSLFNQSLSGWNTSSVSYLEGMFYGCSDFDQSLSGFNTSSVTSMRSMFQGCGSFNHSINSWDTSSVEDMGYMFYGCSFFNQPLNSWNTSSVKNMGLMFSFCSAFNRPLNNWDVSNVFTSGVGSGFWEMFKGCSNFNGSLAGWDVGGTFGNVLYQMFEGCSDFNQSLNSWTTTNIYSTSGMFKGCSSFNQPLNNWDVSNFAYMDYMFEGCSDFNQSLNSWTTTNLISTYSMFLGCSSFNQPLNNWDVSGVSDLNMRLMFSDCVVFNQDLSDWCVTNIPNYYPSFDYNTPAWTLPKPVWGTCPP